MSMSSQQYAGLAQKSYSNEYRSRVYSPDEAPRFEYEGVEYKILEHASNPLNGYQGTIFQRQDTGEIIVAHRGTEPDQGLGQILRDGALTDGAMVAARFNPQTADAIALTRRALDYAEQQGRQPGGQAPEVTVTGHSLGGTHAQITAHQFGLRGETFNAYGAASLGYRIPSGGDHVINHVKAGDFVSAASPHFGQVRVYASADEIATLHAAGYANDRNPLDPRAPGVAAGMLAGSHSMHHFLNSDGEGKPDRSILAEPAARQLTQVFEPMVDKYRSDIALGRAAATVAFRGPAGNTLDLIDELRGPLPAGEPAARAEQAAAVQAERAQRLADYQAQREEQHQRSYRERFPSLDPTAPPPDLLRRPETQGAPDAVRPYHLPEYPGTAPSPQAQAAPPPVPEHLRDFRHPDHPLHTRYTETLAAVHALEDRRGMPHGGNSEQLAAALLAKLDTTRWAGEKDGRAHFGPVGTVELRGQGAVTEAVVVERRDYYHLPARQLGVPVDQALRPVEHTADAWARQKLPHLDAPADAALPQTTRPMPEQLPAYDPRHPAHAGHRGYQQLRGQVADTYAQAGIALSEDQLERATAAVALSNRQKAVPQADLLVLLPDRASGTYGPDSTLVAQYGGNAAVPLRSETTAQQMQRPAEETYQQLQQVDQQLALEQRQREQQREQAQAHGSGMTMA